MKITASLPNEAAVALPEGQHIQRAKVLSFEKVGQEFVVEVEIPDDSPVAKAIRVDVGSDFSIGFETARRSQ